MIAMEKLFTLLTGLLLLSSCYTIKKLEATLPETSKDFPVNTIVAFNDKDTVSKVGTYHDLAFQRNARIIQSFDTIGPAKLNFYYDGAQTLIITPSDYPTKKIKDLTFKVKRNGHHLILQSKFNLIPLVPFMFLWQRQVMALEIDDNDHLLISSHTSMFFYIYLYFTSQYISDDYVSEYVLKPEQTLP